MTTIYRYTPILLLLLFSFAGKTQTRLIDSLKQYIFQAKNDEQKIEAIYTLCNEYKSINRDTLDYYTFLARELAANTHNERLKQMAELAVACDYARWGWADSAIFTVDPLIAANKVTDPQQRDIYFKASRLKAMTYAGRSRYQDALTILYRIVSEAEAYKDSITLGENLNSIGSVALARSNTRDALMWLSRALAACGNDKRFDGIRAGVFINMAEAYLQSGKTDVAVRYSEKGVALFKEVENLSSLALALQKQSSVLIAAGKLDEAEQSLKEMIALRKEAGDGNLYADDNISLAEFYLQTNQVKKAIQFCKNALQVGDVHAPLPGDEQSYANAITIRLGYYQVLARCYKMLEDNSEYQQMLEQIIIAKDSLYKYNSAQAIAELQTQYEVQKKENTIIQQKLDITNKNNRFYALLGIAFFALVIAWIMFTGYRKREKIRLNAMLEKEKSLVAQSIAKAEENERKRIAADLHDNLGAYAASIVSNLDFIEPITHHSSGSVAVQELRNNSQAIVAQLNDTIWALKKDALSLTAISDRIKTFIQRIQNSYPAITINVMENIDNDRMLSPSHAFHLFRIVQEAINNALKHSKGTKVDIIIESIASNWKITIADNGAGIMQRSKDGNGLVNMKERAQETGWSIDWLSEPGKGTSVIISSTTN
ncbi:MAG: sensor histidine kinase [Chitinophagaceae bacterium]|nr:sensor histidine kinase [Chitinophagaceae bacterium]